MFKDGWDAALLVFGLHLVVVGYLVLRSSFAPRSLGVLVAVAGLGYTIDGVGRVLLSGYDANLTRFTFVGELLLMVWLLWKGRRLPTTVVRWES
jgi:hypothetical protein